MNPRLVAMIAMVAHEANRGFCQLMGDDTQVPWDKASDWQRESSCNGVEYILGNWDATPVDLHVSWMAQKIRDGWVYGPVKDPERKTHPCICLYQDLPEDQQFKDALYQSTVRALIQVMRKMPPVPEPAEVKPAPDNDDGEIQRQYKTDRQKLIESLAAQIESERQAWEAYLPKQRAKPPETLESAALADLEHDGLGDAPYGNPPAPAENVLDAYLATGAAGIEEDPATNG